MIVYLATAAATYTVQRSLPYFPDDLRDRIRVWTYRDAARAPELPVATYIFSDVERLLSYGRTVASRLWRTLERSGRPVRLLNHPIRAMRRFDLLRNLHERRINDFTVHRAARPHGAIRFPVFLRDAYLHDGAASGLIGESETLAAEMARLEAAGMRRERMLIVEFCDTADADGIYRKYDAFVVGGRIVPTDMYFSSDWAVKWRSSRLFRGPGLSEAQMTAEELAHARGSSFNAQLATACDGICIDYGRIDFAVKDGRIRIWEINTNPDLVLADLQKDAVLASDYGRQVAPLVREAIFSIFRSLDSGASQEAMIPVEPSMRQPEQPGMPA